MSLWYDYLPFQWIFRSINEKATDYGNWVLVSIGLIEEEKRMKPIFGYFPVQARGQASRMTLYYLGIEYQDDIIGLDWPSHKFNLGLDFPNLPYYIDDDVKLTQANAILRYLGKKHGLFGKNLKEEAEIDMLIQTAEDIMLAFAQKAYDPNFDKLRTEHLKSMEGKLWEVDAFLVGKTFFVGEKVSVADFAMYHPIKWHKELDSEINPVQKDFTYSNINKWLARLESLPEIKYFLASLYHFEACLAPHSKWRGLKL